jgi:hypothetical protein
VRARKPGADRGGGAAQGDRRGDALHGVAGRRAGGEQRELAALQIDEQNQHDDAEPGHHDAVEHGRHGGGVDVARAGAAVERARDSLEDPAAAVRPLSRRFLPVP